MYQLPGGGGAGRAWAQITKNRGDPVPFAGLAVPEHVHLFEAGLQGEQVAAVIHVAGHGVVVDVHNHIRGNLSCGIETTTTVR